MRVVAIPFVNEMHQKTYVLITLTGQYRQIYNRAIFPLFSLEKTVSKLSVHYLE